MCGIIGYVGDRVTRRSFWSQGLKRARVSRLRLGGLATFHDGHDRRCAARSASSTTSRRCCASSRSRGTPGIGHTRWATHGRPSEQNAHPHRAGKVVVIHNGIIENYLELRARAAERAAARFGSETDTEVISHLIDECVQQGCGLAEATRRAIEQLEGSFSIVVCHENEPDRLVAAKSATPIVIGLGDDENFVASDIPAHARSHPPRALPRGRRDGRGHRATRSTITTFDGEPVEREPQVGRLGRGHGAEGRLQALPAEGDPRAAAGDHRHHARPAPAGGGRRQPRREVAEQPAAPTSSAACSSRAARRGTPAWSASS